jgi:hypothetical protein
MNVIDIDMRALAAASALGGLAVVLSGVVPAWLGTRADATDAIRATRQAGTETRGTRLVTRVLLVGEIALACSLLAGSTMLVRSFVNLVNADRGLSLEGALQVRVLGIDRAFPSPKANALGTAAIEATLAGWPEIAAFGLSRELPPTWDTWQVPLEGAHTSTPIDVDSYRVTAGFFDVYRIPILSGRLPATGDAPTDVIIGERLANLLWPGADPLGREFTVGRRERRRVIGVAREVRLPTIEANEDRPEFYEPLNSTSRTLYLNLRCRGACPDAATIAARVRAVHPALDARVVPAPDAAYLSQLELPRAVARVGTVFAVVAIVTAAGGLFGVLSFAVSRRRRELGIRAALGAAPRRLGGLVLRDGFSLVAAGVVLGAAGGWLVARGLSSFQYGVTAEDPMVWAAVLGTVALASFAATWRPARQAARVDPVTLLREE